MTDRVPSFNEKLNKMLEEVNAGGSPKDEVSNEVPKDDSNADTSVGLLKLESDYIPKVINYISNRPSGKASATDLAQYLDLNQTQASDIVALMENKKILSRVPKTSKYELSEKPKEDEVDEESLIPSERLSRKESREFDYLRSVAMDEIPLEDSVKLFKDTRTIDKMKLFTIQMARNELLRVVKLSDTLSIMQDKFMDNVVSGMNTYDNDELASIMSVLASSVDRSFTFLDRFTKDETLRVIIMDGLDDEDIQEMHNPALSVLEDKDSRDKIRKSASVLITSLGKITNPKGGVDNGNSTTSDTTSDDSYDTTIDAEYDESDQSSHTEAVEIDEDESLDSTDRETTTMDTSDTDSVPDDEGDNKLDVSDAAKDLLNKWGV